MQTLDRCILATLAYAGAQRLPLTALEVHERLIPSSRSGGNPHGTVPLSDVVCGLDALTVSGALVCRLGCYALAGTPDEQFWSRMDRQKESADKWKHLRRFSLLLRIAPFVEALWVSGALAQSVAAPSSDWDIFVAARAGRLYTARLFLLALAFVQGRLRTKRTAVVRDLFCFNQYVTTDMLTLRYRSLFTAQAMARLVPLIDDDGWLQRLWDANGWMRSYGPEPQAALSVRRQLPPSRSARAIRQLLEHVLTGAPGDAAERAIRSWMLRRIQADPATHASGGRVVADDHGLEFHPHSQEVAILNEYNRTMARLIPGAPAEADSGLTR